VAEAARGSAPAIVFLPGAGGNPEFWRPVAEELRPCGDPLLLGWPGFGAVPADASALIRPFLAE
jgi:pimeloyl-ACP methyl ester carboxylesterase